MKNIVDSRAFIFFKDFMAFLISASVISEFRCGSSVNARKSVSGTFSPSTCFSSIVLKCSYICSILISALFVF